MAFQIKVDYRAPSHECLFLGNGWSAGRDIRGAYISEPAAEIHIENWALSTRIPSLLTLILSMSGRSRVDAMMVRAAGTFGSKQVLVGKHKSAALLIFPVFCNPILNNVTIILEPSFGSDNNIAASSSTADLVALDELEITRQSA